MSKFKVGDKVRVTGHNLPAPDKNLKGRLGTLIPPPKDIRNPVWLRVRLDNPKGYEHLNNEGLCFVTVELELVEQ